MHACQGGRKKEGTKKKAQRGASAEGSGKSAVGGGDGLYTHGPGERRKFHPGAAAAAATGFGQRAESGGYTDWRGYIGIRTCTRVPVTHCAVVLTARTNAPREDDEASPGSDDCDGGGARRRAVSSPERRGVPAEGQHRLRPEEPVQEGQGVLREGDLGTGAGGEFGQGQGCRGQRSQERRGGDAGAGRGEGRGRRREAERLGEVRRAGGRRVSSGAQLEGEFFLLACVFFLWNFSGIVLDRVLVLVFFFSSS